MVWQGVRRAVGGVRWRGVAVPRVRTLASWSVPTAPYDVRPALDDHGRIPPAPYDRSPLPGTSPEYVTHMILSPWQYAHPVMTWPSHLDVVCPLFSELAGHAQPGGALAGYGVSMATSDPSVGVPDVPPSLTWDPHCTPEMRLPPSPAAEEERFRLVAYRHPGLYVEYPEPVSVRTLPSGDVLRNELDALFAKPEAILTSEAHIYVCAHGMRDCRCGVVGLELLEALEEQVKQHADACRAKGTKPAKRVRVFPVSHVGGHKWAANALVYPHGDWYGNLRPSDAPLLVRAALAPSSSRHDLNDLRERLVLWPRWRGRLGMTSLEQQEHMRTWGPSTVYSAQVVPKPRGDARAAAVPRKELHDAPAGEPASLADTPTGAAAVSTHGVLPASTSSTVPLRFHGYDGTWYDVDGYIGETLMEVAKRNDLPGIEATCEGELECATCHAYLCDASPTDPLARGLVDHPASGLPVDISDDEDDMLEYAIARKPSSRLTCQIPVTHRLAQWMQQGGRAELPRY